MVNAFLQILGTATGDSSPGVLLFFDEARYLFQCGEGLQRFCNQHKVRIITDRCHSVFLTRLHPSTIGGLPGALLTFADAGKTNLQITAPRGLRNFLDAARPFFFRPALKLNLFEIPDLYYDDYINVCRDKHLEIDAVLTSGGNANHQNRRVSSPSESSPRYNNQSSASPRSPQRNQSYDDYNGSPDAHRFQASSALDDRYQISSSPVAYSYICKLRDFPGRFNLEKAQQLGIPRGPGYGVLQKGGSVTLEDGTVITSDQVMGEKELGPTVVLIDCLGEQFVEQVVNHPALQRKALSRTNSGEKKTEEQRLICFVHMCPWEVLTHPKYKAWMNSFASAMHFALHDSISPMKYIFKSQAENIHYLHQSLGDSFFPKPYAESETSLVTTMTFDHVHMKSAACEASKLPNSTVSFLNIESNAQILSPDPLCKILLAPKGNIGLDIREVVSQGLHVAPAPPLKKPRGRPPKDPIPACLENMDDRRAELRFLGTAAAIPGVHRNVSGIFLNLFDRGSIVMDSGEGSWGQLIRSLGREKADEVLIKLKAVWISHMHADHHLGLVGLLAQRERIISKLGATDPAINEKIKPVIVVGPSQLRRWLLTYNECVGFENNFIFMDAKNFLQQDHSSCSYFKEHLGIELHSVNVDHCPQAYGLVLKDQIHGWKVAYSGDTRPSAAFSKAAKNATVMIHEATLSNDLVEEAMDKKHCTFSEAIQACEQAEPYRIILTHFSQRYPRVPLLNEIIGERKNIAVAFDLMKVNFADLKDLPKLTPLLHCLYPHERAYEENEAIP